MLNVPSPAPLRRFSHFLFFFPAAGRRVAVGLSAFGRTGNFVGKGEIGFPLGGSEKVADLLAWLWRQVESAFRLVSGSEDTVTGSALAIAVALEGGIGVRQMPPGTAGSPTGTSRTIKIGDPSEIICFFALTLVAKTQS